ncbi:MAG: hypothetical protein HKN13_02515 [Rhodothermales bacterium]|nr:hypothetical protein [Rhodothermales bacterium]
METETLIDIVLPHDESITEATVLEWLKSPGDEVKEHEPLLEVSTDKVTMEVPSPASGVLQEVIHDEDAVVYPDSVLGRVALQVLVPDDATPVSSTDEDYNADAVVTSTEGPRLSPLVKRMLREHGLSAADVRGSGRGGRITHRDILAKIEGHDAILEHSDSDDTASGDFSIGSGDSSTQSIVEPDDRDHSEGLEPWPDEPTQDLDEVTAEPDSGTELDGVATTEEEQEEGNLWGFLDSTIDPEIREAAAVDESDLDLLELSDCGPPAENESYPTDELDPVDASQEQAAETHDEQPDSDPVDYQSAFEAEVNERRPHSLMRRSIARHMVDSVRTAPHVTALFDADMSRVMTHRELHKSEAERRGIRLTYTAYFVAAAIQAIAEVPETNSVWHDDALEVIRDANIGVATALETEGLIVPVIKKAHELDLFGIARRLQDLVGSARNSTLSKTDVSDGTFTITNHGVSGSLIATPIINQPQSAILGIGRLEKRVVVRQHEGRDSIQVAPMVYITLTIDHRALDGYQANRFLSRFVEVLEGWEFSQT